MCSKPKHIFSNINSTRVISKPKPVENNRYINTKVMLEKNAQKIACVLKV